jgi:hypothetical protein
MPIRESVTQKDVEGEVVHFAPAHAVRVAAYKVAAFVHDGSDASDMYWDMLCEEVRAAVDAWEKACRGG